MLIIVSFAYDFMCSTNIVAVTKINAISTEISFKY